MKTPRSVITGSALIALSGSICMAAPEQQSSTVSACGSLHTNGAIRTVFTVAQPGTAQVSSNNRYTHYAGFMGGAFLRPAVTNDEGTALEASPDNDNDGLTDIDEVSGAAFGGHARTDPNSQDSDGDGMHDADEAAGMYDPNDAGHALQIRALDHGTGNMALTWVGKGGGTVNTILWDHDLVSGAFTNTLYSDTYAGGDAPWYKATNMHVWAEVGVTNMYFRVTTE